MSRKDELVNKIQLIIEAYLDDESKSILWLEKKIVNICLAREREQISKVVEPLRKEYDFSGKTDMWAVAQGQADDIEQSLAIADSILQEG